MDLSFWTKFTLGFLFGYGSSMLYHLWQRKELMKFINAQPKVPTQYPVYQGMWKRLLVSFIVLFAALWLVPEPKMPFLFCMVPGFILTSFIFLFRITKEKSSFAPPSGGKK